MADKQKLLKILRETNHLPKMDLTELKRDGRFIVRAVEVASLEQEYADSSKRFLTFIYVAGVSLKGDLDDKTCPHDYPLLVCSERVSTNFEFDIRNPENALNLDIIERYIRHKKL